MRRQRVRENNNTRSVRHACPTHVAFALIIRPASRPYCSSFGITRRYLLLVVSRIFYLFYLLPPVYFHSILFRYALLRLAVDLLCVCLCPNIPSPRRLLLRNPIRSTVGNRAFPRASNGSLLNGKMDN